MIGHFCGILGYLVYIEGGYNRAGEPNKIIAGKADQRAVGLIVYEIKNRNELNSFRYGRGNRI